MPVSLLQFAQQSNVTTGGSNTTAVPFVAASSLKVLGAATLSNAALLYGPMTACNTATFTSNVTVLGALNAVTVNYSNVTVYQSEEIKSNLLVDGSATLCNGLLSIGAATFSNAATVSGALKVLNGATFSNSVVLSGTLTTATVGSTTLNHALNVGGVASVSNAAFVSSNLVVQGSVGVGAAPTTGFQLDVIGNSRATTSLTVGTGGVNQVLAGSNEVKLTSGGTRHFSLFNSNASLMFCDTSAGGALGSAPIATLMTVNNTGVAVGGTVAAYPLDVTGAARVTGTLIGGNAGAANASWALDSIDTTIAPGAYRTLVVGSNNQTNAACELGFYKGASDAASALGLGFFNNSRLVNLLPSGYLGVGTSNPQFMLDVVASTRTQILLVGSNTSTNTLQMQTALGGGAYNLITKSNDAAVVFYPPSSNASLVLVPWTGGLVGACNGGLAVCANGSVGVNTSSPSAAFSLDVAGAARSTGLVVTGNQSNNGQLYVGSNLSLGSNLSIGGVTTISGGRSMYINDVNATALNISGFNLSPIPLLSMLNPSLNNATVLATIGRSNSPYGQGYISYTNANGGVDGNGVASSNYMQLGLWNAGLPQSLNITSNGIAIGATSNVAYSFQVGRPGGTSMSMAVYGGDSTIDPFSIVRPNDGVVLTKLHYPSGNVNTSWNTYEAMLYVGCGSNPGSGRSINLSGTVNTNGADYAEYVYKADSNVVLAKGDLVGYDSNGLLTPVFADAVAFAIKTTNPSYVGGDTWHQGAGPEPARPPPDASDDELAAYQAALAAYQQLLEDERQKVDRVAMSGRVPVNVLGAQPGDYIVPYSSNGVVAGQAVPAASLTMRQYVDAVGRTISVQEDGRAFVLVKSA